MTLVVWRSTVPGRAASGFFLALGESSGLGGAEPRGRGPRSLARPYCQHVCRASAEIRSLPDHDFLSPVKKEFRQIRVKLAADPLGTWSSHGAVHTVSPKLEHPQKIEGALGVWLSGSCRARLFCRILSGKGGCLGVFVT